MLQLYKHLIIMTSLIHLLFVVPNITLDAAALPQTVKTLKLDQNSYSF